MGSLRLGVRVGPICAGLCAAAAVSCSAYGQTPDIAGTYWATEYRAKIAIVGGGELPLTAAGKAAYEKNIAGLKDGSISDVARRYCVPDGLPRVLATPYPFEIFQAPPGQVTIVYELNHQVRVVAMGKPLPNEEELTTLPFYNGHSVGRYEGDTLVIESAGFNDRTWIDGEGHPHSEALRVTERLRRPDFGHLEIQKTLVDPGALMEPWTIPLKLELEADTEPLEYVCNENERDRQHLVGKASDDKSIAVATAVLSKYVGSYELKIPGTDRILTLEISLSGDQLSLGGFGAAKAPLIATSETEFSSLGTSFRFVTDDRGLVTHLILQGVEGDFKAIRR